MAELLNNYEDILSLTGEILDPALDNPINRMSSLFPAERFPEKAVRQKAYTIMACSIDLPDDYDEAVALWKKKTGKNQQQLDIMINAILDAEFEVMTMMLAEEGCRENMIVKRSSHYLREETQMKNGLYEDPDYNIIIV